jgi:oligopeptide/dipeptide ABC transporter ATP-binding protein
MSIVMKVENLSAHYWRDGRKLKAVRHVSFDLREGEMLGLIGESACGKSTLAMALLRLLPEGTSEISRGRVLFGENDLLRLPPEALRRVRGGQIGMVFQDPFSALNPVFTVGEQVVEALVYQQGAKSEERRVNKNGTEQTIQLFKKVRLPQPERIFNSYPHQLSGGQRQRVCLAMAIASRPRLLIADEPTTALDVTTQMEILDLLDELRKELSMTVLLVTHNLGLLAERADRLAVMYAGEIVELGPTRTLLHHPLHPYTKGLLKSLPRLSDRQSEIENRQSHRLPVLEGAPPDLRHLPAGCPFHPRCPHVFEACRRLAPQLQHKEGRDVSCHLYKISE